MKFKKYMPFFLIFLCIFLWPPGGFAATEAVESDAVKVETIKWYPYEEGMATGKKQRKKIFLHFYSNGCRYCIIMANKSFKDPLVVDYLNKNFISIMVNVDLERRLAMVYRIRPLPTTLFIEPDGEKIGGKPGYISPEDLLLFLKYVNTDSYNKMSMQEFVEGLKNK